MHPLTPRPGTRHHVLGGERPGAAEGLQRGCLFGAQRGADSRGSWHRDPHDQVLNASGAAFFLTQIWAIQGFPVTMSLGL